MSEQEITSLGWIRDIIRSGYKLYYSNIYELSNQSMTANILNKWIIRGPLFGYPEEEQRQVIFRGTIDSIDEFKILMKQLEITT